MRAMSHPHRHPHHHAAPASGNADAASQHPGHAAAPDRKRKLLIALALTTAMLIAETVGGLWSGSLALLADAGHMLVDALALLLAFLGTWLAQRPPDARRSYGYGRLEVLAGFVNALMQLVLVAAIAYEAIVRLRHPEPILSDIMLVVAGAGLLVNIGVLRMLHGHAHDDVNMAGAALHVMGDLLGSVGAVAAALLIRWLQWGWADPVLSLLVSGLILNSAWRLLRKSAHILLEGVPEDLDTDQIKAALDHANESINAVHHLHVWQLASGARMATLHVDLREGGDSAEALHGVHTLLRERFGIRHATVQIDPAVCPDAHRGQGRCHGSAG